MKKKERKKEKRREEKDREKRKRKKKNQMAVCHVWVIMNVLHCKWATNWNAEMLSSRCQIVSKMAVQARRVPKLKALHHLHITVKSFQTRSLFGLERSRYCLCMLIHIRQVYCNKTRLF